MLKENSTVENKQLIDYPADIPNQSCHHAFVKGIIIENSFCSSVGDYSILFETEYEKIYTWTYSKHENASIISDISISVKENNFWKTAGSLIKLSLAYCRAFEGLNYCSNLEYKMMYYFSPNDPFENIQFADLNYWDSIFMFNGLQLTLTDIASLATVMELINRDDKCYTALSLLFSSFQIHHCCLICELGLSSCIDHTSHEPELWEQADYITNLESALVQACRCAESIIGEPPNKNKQSRVMMHKQKWADLIGINPDELFERSGLSYLDFYIKLFDELRNPSAHSYGNIHFDLRRKHTIDAQCLAALVLQGYIGKNVISFEEAMNNLRFNKTFLN